jgi:SpoVK/Ycf46/Vps4 family AAA+-type ATPase
MVRQALKGVPCDLKDEQYSQLAEKVEKYSGRDLVAVCREAAMQPVRGWGRGGGSDSLSLMVLL